MFVTFGRLGVHNEYIMYMNSGVLRCLAGFSLGVIIYRWLEPIKISLDNKKRKQMVIYSFLQMMSCAVFFYIMFSNQHNYNDFLALIFILVAISISFMQFDTLLNRLLNLRVLVFLGKISYSIYLMHYSVQYVMQSLLGMKFDFSLKGYINLVVFISIVILISTIVYFMVENRSIPMAGLSSRFFKAGYTKPKYQLDLNGETVFSWSVRSFERYFKTDKFVFIYRDVYDTKQFLEKAIVELGILDYELVCLPEETLGQADTVYQGINKLDHDEEIYVFNIDSRIIDFVKPEWVNDCDGYLEVFKGEGEHWSFALAEENSKKVIRTTEKERISDLCSDGLYYFKRKSVFERLFLSAKENRKTAKNEYYIAPLYNDLIEVGSIVFYDLIENERILFCGTPDEYQQLLKEDA